MNKWVIRKKSGNFLLLSETMGVSRITAQILINRGLLKEDLVDDFLNTDLKRLKDFKKAYGVTDGIEILKQAISNGEKITIYGDYDVDGVTSTTILYKTIKSLTNNVNYFLPNRHLDGYGLNIERIDDLIKDGTNLIITCDNGIASAKENDYIQKNGLKHIVIDHHEEPLSFDENLSVPNAVIDPKQSKCTYNFKEMCAAGLSYRFSVLLLEEFKKEVDFLDELLVFSMIGTICDIVPLSFDNRIIVKEGLKVLNNNKNINLGLYDILYRKDCVEKECNTYTAGFIIGPTINSAGRLSEGMLAVELFTTDDTNRIDEIGELLFNLNSKRQELTKDATEEIIEKVENENIKDEKVIIVYSKKCDEAVAGIVSGRIKEKYNKPTMVVTGEGDVLKGSCRSISNYDMFKELSSVKEHFIKFGGHKMAAGFSLYNKDYDKFKEDIINNCTLTDEDYIRIIAVDDILELGEINYKEAESLEILKPYGEYNKEPLFASTKVKVKSVNIYEEKNTLVLGLTDINENVEIKGITFSLLDKFYEIIEENFDEYTANKILNGVVRDIDLMLDIVYYIGINDFRNKKSVQLKIEDFRISNK